MNLIEYFAVIDEDGIRAGPFERVEEATRFLKQAALEREYTDERAEQFFLNGSAVVRVVTGRDKVVFFNLNWRAGEKSTEEKPPAENRESLPEMVMAKAPSRKKPK